MPGVRNGTFRLPTFQDIMALNPLSVRPGQPMAGSVPMPAQPLNVQTGVGGGLPVLNPSPFGGGLGISIAPGPEFPGSVPSPAPLSPVMPPSATMASTGGPSPVWIDPTQAMPGSRPITDMSGEGNVPGGPAQAVAPARLNSAPASVNPNARPMGSSPITGPASSAPAPRQGSGVEYYQYEDDMGRKLWSTRPTNMPGLPSQQHLPGQPMPYLGDGADKPIPVTGAPGFRTPAAQALAANAGVMPPPRPADLNPVPTSAPAGFDGSYGPQLPQMPNYDPTGPQNPQSVVGNPAPGQGPAPGSPIALLGALGAGGLGAGAFGPQGPGPAFGGPSIFGQEAPKPEEDIFGGGGFGGWLRSLFGG